LICLQWYVLVLTFSLAIYMLLGKYSTRPNLGNYAHKPFTDVFPTTRVVLYCVKRRLHKRVPCKSGAPWTAELGWQVWWRIRSS